MSSSNTAIPLHAFDFDQLGEGPIVVQTRRGRGEFSRPWTVRSATLRGPDLTIGDGRKGRGPGRHHGRGEFRKVPGSTTNILLESAYFNPYLHPAYQQETGDAYRGVTQIRTGDGHQYPDQGPGSRRLTDSRSGRRYGRQGVLDVYPNKFEARSESRRVWTTSTAPWACASQRRKSLKFSGIWNLTWKHR